MINCLNVDVACIELPLRNAPQQIGTISTRAVLAVVFFPCVTLLSWATNLASKRIVYGTASSIAVYIIWLLLVTSAHAKGLLVMDAVLLPMGDLWQFIREYLVYHVRNR